MSDEEVSGQIEAIWEVVTRLEGQLANIRTDLDDLRHREVRNLRTETWQLESKISGIERDLQSVQRVCR